MKRALVTLVLALATGAVVLPVYLTSAPAVHTMTRSPYVVASADGERRGCPLLLVTDPAGVHPLSAYLAEIARAEGWPCTRTATPDDLTPRALEAAAAVLLTRVSLDEAERQTVRDFVRGGGRLVAMRPDAALADVFGVQPIGGPVTGGDLRLDAAHPATAGLASGALPVHAAVDQYRLAGAQPVGWWHAGREAVTPSVAVASHVFGEGRAVLWAFDLGEQVALARQGDPARADQERDGLEGIRAVDLFADRLDLATLPVPYADEQQRLLGNLLAWELADHLPLPRVWYLPGHASAVLVATSDAHENIEATIDEVVGAFEARNGHVSIYYTPPSVTPWHRAVRRARWTAATLPLIGGLLRNPTSLPSPSRIADWTARGHDFSPHPDGLPSADAGLLQAVEAFSALGYPIDTATLRTHRILWHGWVDSAREQAARGVRMNLDFYQVGPAFERADGQWAWGHFTGSALPMRFVDEAGRVIDSYQQPTQFVDEHVLGPLGGFAGLSVDQSLDVLASLFPEDGDGRAVAIGAQFHVDPFAVGGDAANEARRLLEGALDLASRRGAPILSAGAWLAFVTARDETMIQDLVWDEAGRTLTFRVITAPPEPLRTSLLVPAAFRDGALTGVAVDGAPVSADIWSTGGALQRLVPLNTGEFVVRATYASGPTEDPGTAATTEVSP